VLDQADTLHRIQEALAEIRPFLQNDGGDISLVDYADNEVFVRFEGNCSHCKINNLTLNIGVKRIIKKYLPEVKQVKSVN